MCTYMQQRKFKDYVLLYTPGSSYTGVARLKEHICYHGSG